MVADFQISRIKILQKITAFMVFFILISSFITVILSAFILYEVKKRPDVMIEEIANVKDQIIEQFNTFTKKCDENTNDIKKIQEKIKEFKLKDLF